MIMIGILLTNVGVALTFLVERHEYRNKSYLVDSLALPLAAQEFLRLRVTTLRTVCDRLLISSGLTLCVALASWHKYLV